MKSLFIIGSMMVVLMLVGPDSAYAQKRKATKATKPASAPAKPLPALTAEGYRDLIVNTADAMRSMLAYAEITAGTGTEYVNYQRRECILTFTVTESTAMNIANRRKAWESARVPKALTASHAEILNWMKIAEEKSKLVPSCYEASLQASKEQWYFLVWLGDYDELRKNAATALNDMAVSLPPIVKPKTEDK